MSERVCGRISKVAINKIAHRCTLEILDFVGPRAVCLAPDGEVTVETPETCVETDLVGTYTADTGLLELWRLIDGDIREAAAERGIEGKPKHSTRVPARKYAKRAAA